MQPRFSPTRQGAKYALDEGDLVILAGTPVYRRDGGSYDTRIRVGRNGHAERAVWIRRPLSGNEAGLCNEFHLWSHKLDESVIAKIDEVLKAVARCLPSTPADRDPNEPVRSMRFWHAGRHIELAVGHPEEDRLAADQVAAFREAWDLVDAAIPAGA